MKTIPQLLMPALQVLALSYTLAGQGRINLSSGNTCHYFPDDLPDKEYYLIEPSQEAVVILEELLKTINVRYANILLKSSSVRTAVATIDEDDNRYILYNNLFISSLQRSEKDKWIVFSILAHEVGHHILGHRFDESNPARRREYELAADDFSGAILRSLCASQEDALAAISNLPHGEVSAYYPPINARKQVIAQSWYLKNESYLKEGNDPCGNTIELKFGEKYKNLNRASNVIARVKEEEMIIEYDARGIPEFSGYESFMITDPISRLEPRTITWLTDHNRVGDARQLIWNFAEDGYSKNQVMKGALLGIGVFERNNVPERVQLGGYAIGAGAVILGASGFVYGSSLKSQAKDMHEFPYATIRNPNDQVYLDPNPSRQEVYNTANKKYHQAQLFQSVGAVLVSGGLTWLVNKLIIDRRAKIGHLHQGKAAARPDAGRYYGRK